MNVLNLIEKFLIKKRLIVEYSLSPYDKNESVCFFNMCEKVPSVIKKTNDERLRSLVYKRINDSSWILFFYLKDNEIMGYSFIHAPSDVEWNDSLPTLPGEGRTSSTFVYPKHRGKRVRNYIAQQQVNYSIENNIKLWSVIERVNKSSLKASSRTGEIRSTNYLVKLLGRNIISFTITPFKVYSLFGARRARR